MWKIFWLTVHILAAAGMYICRYNLNDMIYFGIYAIVSSIYLTRMED